MKAAIHSLTLLGLILSTEAFSSKIQHDSADPSSCSGPLINSDGSVVMADEQKANCLAKEAANKKDAEICKQVASKFYVDCFAEVAVALKEPDLCSKLVVTKNGAEDQAPKWDCIVDYARKTKDRRICKRLPEISMPWITCWQMQIPIDGDKCSPVPGMAMAGDYGYNPRARCYTQRAAKEGDPLLCENVNPCTYEVYECYNGAATAKNDPGICDKIPVCNAMSGHKSHIANCVENVAEKNKRPELCKGLAHASPVGYCAKLK